MHGHKTPRPVFVQIPKEKTFTEKQVIKFVWAIFNNGNQPLSRLKKVITFLFK
jgi:hypothetical protein